MTTFTLKVIATIAMILDHIAYFFPSSHILFHWIGRISAPIFIFCMVNGVLNTKSKKKYCVRLYFSSVLMAFIQIICHTQLNFLRTLFVICIVLCIIEHYKDNKKLLKKYVALYMVYQIGTCLLCGYLIQISGAITEAYFTYMLPAVLGSLFSVNGGLIYILIGWMFYRFYHKPKQMSITYVGLAVGYTFLMTSSYVSSFLYRIGRMNHTLGVILDSSYEYIMAAVFDMEVISMGGSIIYDNYQWMMICALYPILKYNGQIGTEIKYFFYLFYPLHIILIWSISYIC